MLQNNTMFHNRLGVRYILLRFNFLNNRFILHFFISAIMIDRIINIFESKNLNTKYRHQILISRYINIY